MTKTFLEDSSTVGPRHRGVGDAGASPDLPGSVEGLEVAESLDATAAALWEVLPDWVVTGWGRQLLGEMWLGRSLHPVLSDLPLGCWSTATVLDLLGGGRYAGAARQLVGLGLLQDDLRLGHQPSGAGRRRSRRDGHLPHQEVDRLT